MGWDSYALLNDPTVRMLLPKVECAFDPEIEAEFPTNMSGKLTIEARGQHVRAEGRRAEGRTRQFPVGG